MAWQGLSKARLGEHRRAGDEVGLRDLLILTWIPGLLSTDFKAGRGKTGTFGRSQSSSGMVVGRSSVAGRIWRELVRLGHDLKAEMAE